MKGVQFITCLLLAFCVSSSALAESPQEKTEQQSSNELVWIDVRTWLENKVDSIEGDPNIPISELVEGVTERFPDKSTPIRLYCASGGRSGKALNQLVDLGYSNVENVGGIADARKLRFSAEATAVEALPAN